MADLSQTPANVAIGSANCPTKVVTYGEAITQGNAVYQSTTDSKYYKADADAAATAIAAGIALTPGSTDGVGLIAQPSTVAGRSLVNLGATLTVGQVYVVSATAGNVAPYADLTTGDFVTILGVATTTALIDFQVVVSNTAKP
jgi:hypothetical protein